MPKYELKINFFNEFFKKLNIVLLRPFKRVGWARLIVLISFVLLVSSILTARLIAQNNVPTEQIIVDQFGWRPKDVKVAIFADPVIGKNSNLTYQPGSKFEIRREDTDQTVYTGLILSWKEGEVDLSSGDRVWWGDFTDFETKGIYYIYDPKNKVRSYPFDIRNDVYSNVLKTAVKAFYYQRCGTEIPVKYGGQWTHPPCHIGRNQDLAALRYTTDSRPKDVHGGWHDAGDMNKYVSFTPKVFWNLINAYEINPSAFSDDYNIPESGNGVPDILDEMKWELDWILRMQLGDGSVANRVASPQGGCRQGMPQEDRERRYYSEPTTWATASLIVGSANASRMFKQFDTIYPGYSNRLISASEKAWGYLERTPDKKPENGRDYGSKKRLSCASQAGLEGSDQMLRLWAASELYRATGKLTYKNYFNKHYVPLKDNWFDPMGGNDRPWEQQFAYITYALTQDTDATKIAEIKVALKETINRISGNLDLKTTLDPYRALIWDYHWGSNFVKANWGMTFLFAKFLNIDDLKSQFYEKNAEEYLHYLHGRNPLSWVYLTNMGTKGSKTGAEKSIMQVFHNWFHDGSIYDGAQSKYGPAPGFLSGGPNKYYSVKQISPPFGEPPQKAYKDWNSGWNLLGHFSEESWTITEPAIYYQAAYVNLLAYFCSRNT
ncbi:MAG: glycoside hydrolase family 9 protein [Sphaerospermopsis kisseleviana]